MGDLNMESTLSMGRSKHLQDALTALLSLPSKENESRGLVFTPKEIYQQPDTWRNTFHKLSQKHSEILKFLEQSGIRPGSPNPPTVLLVGAGTSDYIGRSLSRLLSQQWRCEVMAVPSTELITNMEEFILPDKEYLWISFSRSGDSSEGVAVLEQALDRYPHQIRHLIVTCNQTGIMVQRFAQNPSVMCILLDDVVNDRGLAMTSSFSNLVITGQYLAYIWSPEEYESLLDALTGMGQLLLSTAADLTAQLANTQVDKVCFLGTGALQAVAEESALKVLELNAGKIHTIAQSPLGLRHGPLSFIDANTLIVAYLSGDEHRKQYEIDLLEELHRKQLGSAMLVVVPFDDCRLTSLTPNVLVLQSPDSFPDGCRPPIDVIVGQLLGLFFAVKNGIHPDSPSSNGAISRVVSHVKIYSRTTRAKT